MEKGKLGEYLKCMNLHRLAQLYQRRFMNVLIYLSVPFNRQEPIHYEDFFFSTNVWKYVNTVCNETEKEEEIKEADNNGTNNDDDDNNNINNDNETQINDIEKHPIETNKTDFIGKMIMYICTLVDLLFRESTLLDLCFNRRGFNRCGFYLCNNTFLNDISPNVKYKVDTKQKNILPNDLVSLFCSKDCMNIMTLLMRKAKEKKKEAMEGVSLEKQCKMIHIFLATFFPQFELYDVLFLIKNIDQIHIKNFKIYLSKELKEQEKNERESSSYQYTKEPCIQYMETYMNHLKAEKENEEEEVKEEEEEKKEEIVSNTEETTEYLKKEKKGKAVRFDNSLNCENYQFVNDHESFITNVSIFNQLEKKQEMYQSIQELLKRWDYFVKKYIESNHIILNSTVMKNSTTSLEEKEEHKTKIKKCIEEFCITEIQQNSTQTEHDEKEEKRKTTNKIGEPEKRFQQCKCIVFEKPVIVNALYEESEVKTTFGFEVNYTDNGKQVLKISSVIHKKKNHFKDKEKEKEMPPIMEIDDPEEYLSQCNTTSNEQKEGDVRIMRKKTHSIVNYMIDFCTERNNKMVTFNYHNDTEEQAEEVNCEKGKENENKISINHMEEDIKKEETLNCEKEKIDIDKNDVQCVVDPYQCILQNTLVFDDEYYSSSDLNSSSDYESDTLNHIQGESKYVYSKNIEAVYTTLGLGILLWDFFSGQITNNTILFFKKVQVINEIERDEDIQVRRTTFLQNMRSIIPEYLIHLYPQIVMICTTFKFHKALLPYKKSFYLATMWILLLGLNKANHLSPDTTEENIIKEAKEYLIKDNKMEPEEVDDVVNCFFMNSE